MFGPGTQSGTLALNGNVTGAVASPFFGGAGLNIAQNNSLLPTDRVFVSYRRFTNATLVNLNSGADTFAARDYFDLYTAGIEKAFWGSQLSVEVRAPLMQSGLAEARTLNGNTFDFATGTLSYVDSVIKGVLWETDSFAVTAGTGMRFYTGASMGDFSVNQEAWSYERTGVDFVPFIGVASALPWGTFSQALVQYTLPTDDDVLSAVIAGNEFSGALRRDQVLSTTVSAGKWLINNPARGYLQNLAITAEATYSLAMNEPRQITVAPGAGLTTAQLNLDRFDALSVAGGISASLYRGISLQAGVSNPIRLDDTRFSDTEFHAALNWRF